MKKIIAMAAMLLAVVVLTFFFHIPPIIIWENPLCKGETGKFSGKVFFCSDK